MNGKYNKHTDFSDYYLIFYNGSSNSEGEYYLHGATANLQYTHYLVGLHAQHMFYRVVAYKNYGRGTINLEEPGSTRGMPEKEIYRLLD